MSAGATSTVGIVAIVLVLGLIGWAYLYHPTPLGFIAVIVCSASLGSTITTAYIRGGKR